MKNRLLSTLLLCLPLLAITTTSGCGGRSLPKTVPAEGVVTLDGNPVADATLTFISESHIYHSTGNTNAEGKFAMRAFPEKTGAVPGSYKVEISKSVQGTASSTNPDEPVTLNLRNELPGKYASMVTSGLTASVSEEGSSKLLKSLPVAPPALGLCVRWGSDPVFGNHRIPPQICHNALTDHI